MATPGARSPDDRRARVLALLGVALFGFAFLGTRGLLEPDEGRYSNVAAQMIRSGDYLVPALNEDTPHYTKPPLTYWAIAASTRALGHSPWAARLPNGLAWLATVWLVGAIARRLGEPDPRLARAAYAAMALPYLGASVVTTDTLLAAFETLAVLGVVGLWRAPSPGARLALGMGLGLAFLTKGPVGLLPLLPAALAFAAVGEARQLRRWLHPGTVVPFLAIGGSWFAWLALSEPDVLRALVRDEIYGRVVEGRFDRHPEWYGALSVYGPAFLVGALPWTPLAFTAPRALVRPFQRSFWRELRASDPAGLFLWLWWLVPLAVLALVRSRLPLYLLPCFPPLALLVARRLAGTRWASEPVRALAASWIVVLVGARALAAALPLEASSVVLEKGLREHLRMKRLERVVFVDQTPRWGIGYTFDVVVEGARMDDDDAFPPIEVVLARDDPHRVFVMQRVSEGSFRRHAARVGYGVRRRGAWDHEVYLEASPKLPIDLEVRQGWRDEGRRRPRSER